MNCVAVALIRLLFWEVGVILLHKFIEAIVACFAYAHVDLNCHPDRMKRRLLVVTRAITPLSPSLLWTRIGVCYYLSGPSCLTLWRPEGHFPPIIRPLCLICPA